MSTVAKTATKDATPEDKAFIDTLTRAGLVLLVIGQAAIGRTDTDIWGHMSIGLDMLREHRFLWVDPYSFTHDQPWINHEWLWDVIVAGIYRVAGLPGLVALRALLVGAVLWIVDRATRRAPGWVRIGALLLAAAGCTGQWRSLRPQMATLPICALFLTNIEAWWIPLLFVLWANVHGGWAFGLTAIVVHALLRRSTRSIAIAAASVAGTLVNPYGVHLWTAIADATQRGWSDLTEWQPVWRLAAGVDAIVLWLIVAAAAAWLARRMWRPALEMWRPALAGRDSGYAWPLVWTLVSLAAAARSRRLTALAALSVVLLMVPAWKQETTAASFTWTSPRRSVAAIVCAMAGAFALLTVAPSLGCFPPLTEWRTAPEPESVAFLRSAGVTRVVPHFDYGEYAIFHLRDRLRVAIDNRRETVYSDAVVRENQRFADGLDPDYPDRIGADAVWWPAGDDRIVAELAQRGWVRRFVGPRTVVLMKESGPVTRTDRAVTGTPCFPNP